MQRTIGKYEILGELGAGGMAVVYKARDPLLERLVALKVINQKHAVKDVAFQRFLNEAKVAASLTHPNIVGIHELGIEAGQPFIAMEYLEGRDLRQVIEQKQRMSLRSKVNIALQVARALGYAHARGVVHRDVKPGNIRLLPDGAVKLMDFGIAKLTTESIQKLTRTGAVIGTISYMSPEQLQGTAVGPASDIFSFGVVLYELLAGRAPFDAPSAPAIIYRIVHQPMPSLEAPGLPEPLRRLVERCLTKDPQQRPPSFEPIVAELGRLRQSLRRADTGGDADGLPALAAAEATLPARPENDRRGTQVLGSDEKTIQIAVPAAGGEAGPGQASPREAGRRGTETSQETGEASARRRARLPATVLGLFLLVAGLGVLAGTASRWLLGEEAARSASGSAVPPAPPLTPEATPLPADEPPARLEVLAPPAPTSTPGAARLAAPPPTSTRPPPPTSTRPPPPTSTRPPSPPPTRPPAPVSTRPPAPPPTRPPAPVSTRPPPPTRPARRLPPRTPETAVAVATGTLRLIVEPWAYIRIDGGADLQTPLRPLELPAGTHRLEARREGFRTEKRSFEVAPGQAVNLRILLTPLGYGTVRVLLEGAPWAYIRIDGAAELQVPHAPLRLPEGEHTLEAYRKGYRTVTRRFRLQPDQDLPITIRLEP